MKEISLKSNEGFKRRIERYVPKSNVIDYAFVCSAKKFMVNLHYLEKQKRTIHCFEGKCCEDGHKFITATIYLIGVYTDYKDPTAPIDFQFIRATKAVDETLRKLAEQFDNEKDFCKIDLQLALDTSVGEQYKKLEITPVITGGRKATKEQLIDLKARMDKVIGYLESEVAEVVTSAEYNKIMSSGEEKKEQPIPKKPAMVATPAKTEVELGTVETEAPEKESVDVEEDISIDDLL